LQILYIKETANSSINVVQVLM